MGDWTEHAACRDMPTDIFFPEQGEHTTAVPMALATCAECPEWVRAACLDAGLDERYGIWGGLTGLARRQERSRRARAAGKTPKPRTGGLQPCGTVAAYKRHERRSERPCDACRAAKAHDNRMRRLRLADTRPAAQEAAS